MEPHDCLRGLNLGPDFLFLIVDEEPFQLFFANTNGVQMVDCFFRLASCGVDAGARGALRPSGGRFATPGASVLDCTFSSSILVLMKGVLPYQLKSVIVIKSASRG